MTNGKGGINVQKMYLTFKIKKNNLYVGVVIIPKLSAINTGN